MTAMGVVIGTSAIVVLIALSTGLRQQTVTNFSSFGTAEPDHGFLPLSLRLAVIRRRRQPDAELS